MSRLIDHYIVRKIFEVGSRSSETVKKFCASKIFRYMVCPSVVIQPPIPDDPS